MNSNPNAQTHVQRTSTTCVRAHQRPLSSLYINHAQPLAIRAAILRYLTLICSPSTMDTDAAAPAPVTATSTPSKGGLRHDGPERAGRCGVGMVCEMLALTVVLFRLTLCPFCRCTLNPPRSAHTPLPLVGRAHQPYTNLLYTTHTHTTHHTQTHTLYTTHYTHTHTHTTHYTTHTLLHTHTQHTQYHTILHYTHIRVLAQ